MEKTLENKLWAFDQVELLSCMKYFPTKERGVQAVIDRFLSMLPAREDGEWLITWILDHEEEFPPPAKMRQILDDHRCDPADMVEPQQAAEAD